MMNYKQRYVIAYSRGWNTNKKICDLIFWIARPKYLYFSQSRRPGVEKQSDHLNHCILVTPYDRHWRRRTWSTLVQVMAWCLEAPSHYLIQCWSIISDVLWQSWDDNFTANTQDICPWYEFENYQFQITEESPGDQCVEYGDFSILVNTSTANCEC